MNLELLQVPGISGQISYHELENLLDDPDPGTRGAARSYFEREYSDPDPQDQEDLCSPGTGV
jgi:hypothetical protein